MSAGCAEAVSCRGRLAEIECFVCISEIIIAHRDAKQLLKPVRSVPAGIRPLANIIVEYVALKEAAIRRDTYLRRNPALQEIDDIIARRSECQKSVQELAAQAIHDCRPIVIWHIDI